MRTQYGDCAECGFPILIKDSNPVACPYCATKNLPIANKVSTSSAFPWMTVILVAAVVLVVGYAGAKHGK